MAPQCRDRARGPAPVLVAAAIATGDGWSARYSASRTPVDRAFALDPILVPRFRVPRGSRSYRRRSHWDSERRSRCRGRAPPRGAPRARLRWWRPYHCCESPLWPAARIHPPFGGPCRHRELTVLAITAPGETPMVDGVPVRPLGVSRAPNCLMGAPRSRRPTGLRTPHSARPRAHRV